MAGMFFRAAYLCVLVAFAFIGVRLTQGAPDQPWQEVILLWLRYVGLPLAFFTAAAVMATIPVTKWFLDRRYARGLQNHVRQSLVPQAIRQMDAADALTYLLNESVWGWRTYAKLNSWGWVDGLHLREFERAAQRGDILTIGLGSREGSVVPIERRLWADGRIEERNATLRGHVTMDIRLPVGLGRRTYSQLAIAEADLMQVWPKASLVRRGWSIVWVWLKRRLWYGSKLSNALEEWRRKTN
jgi:hypothetical protein